MPEQAPKEWEKGARVYGISSILFGSQESNLKKDTPDFFKDLQLDYLVERILEQTKGYQTYQYFYKKEGSHFLVAERKENGTRTFKRLVGEPTYTSFGTDLFKVLEG